MNKNRTKPEIMAPAGNWISLQAAINAGCDAVYFGLKGTNMRANAKNFSVRELPEIVKHCRKNNVRAYLTLNTIIYQSEIQKFEKLVMLAKEAEVDAVICWDFAIIQLARKYQVPIFISTQMSVSNSESIRFFYETLGVKRYVLARECSLEDIVKMRNELEKKLGSQKADEIEIEVFAHGAMCVAVSGRCLLSHSVFGKSANRGECSQQCRREYKITDKEGKSEYIIGQDYIMSAKDLSTLTFIENLLEAGIDSLKIEGRGRSPEYVSVVIKSYRQAVDFYSENYQKPDFKKRFEKLKQKLYADVSTVYNRGFSNGFYLGKPLNEWAQKDGTAATTRKIYIGKVVKYYPRIKVAEIKVENNGFEIGDQVMIQGEKTGVVSMVAESMQMENQNVNEAPKGSFVGLKVENKVSENDKLYLIQKVESSIGETEMIQNCQSQI